MYSTKNLSLASKCLILFTISIFLISCTTETSPVYQLSVTADPIDAGSVSPQSSEYNEGEEIELTATSNEHWVFDRWRGDFAGDTNPVLISMNSDKEITAHFIKREYPLTIHVEGEGFVNEKVVQTKNNDYPHGSTVELTAHPSSGWEFVEWTGDIVKL
ncbi:hypothetical protein BH23BAC3_BH23BAC3_36050 [soil metagenome]